MMIPSAFKQWCRTLALPLSTCCLLTTIYTSQLLRHVSSCMNNMSGMYRSHKVEWWVILVMMCTSDALGFFDQLHTFKLRYLGKSGKKMKGKYYILDFLVLHNASVYFEEWRIETEFKQLATHYHSDVQQMKDGRWHSLPVETSVEPLERTFHLCFSAELHPIYINNLNFLADYIRFRVPLCMSESIQTSLLQRISETPHLPLSVSIDDSSGIHSNNVYVLLTQDQVCAYFYAVPLIQNGHAHLYLNFEQAHLHLSRLAYCMENPLLEGGTSLSTSIMMLWDGHSFTKGNPRDTLTTLLPEKEQLVQTSFSFFLQLPKTVVIIRLERREDFPAASREVEPLMDQTSPSEQEQVNEHFILMEAYLLSEKKRYAYISPHVLHRRIVCFREAKTLLDCAYIGLLSCHMCQGNYASSVLQEARKLMDTVITEQFETHRCIPFA